MNVVIVGARERSMDDGRPFEEDKTLVEEIIRDRAKEYGRRLNVASIGCDKGIGKVVRDFCIANDIIFVEVRMKLEGKAGTIPRSFFVHVFQARNPALVELGDEFYIFKGPNENGIVEGVINQAIAKVGEQRVKVYEKEG